MIMIMNIHYTELHLEERIIAAKAKAQRIKKAIDIDTIEDAELVVRYVLSKHYNIPLFDKYFDDRTLDELFFEAELVLPEKPAVESASEAIKENKAEVDGIMDEFGEWLDKTDQPLDPAAAVDPFFAMAQKFMQTGDFAGVGSNTTQKTNDNPKETENE